MCCTFIGWMEKVVVDGEAEQGEDDEDLLKKATNIRYAVKSDGVNGCSIPRAIHMCGRSVLWFTSLAGCG
jgi:hypothetical protein